MNDVEKKLDEIKEELKIMDLYRRVLSRLLDNLAKLLKEYGEELEKIKWEKGK